MTRKQEIVPVRLQDEKQSVNPQQRKQNPQKLIARLKLSDSELFIYEGIREPLLQVLLAELCIHENN